jgi:hypothetical protein
MAILALICEYLLPSGLEARITEVAGNLLTHRYASRKSDDFVIWSLLSSENGFETAEEMWNSKILSSVKTGYLVSTAARLNVPGFRWAPTSPSPYPPKDQEIDIPLVYLSWDGVHNTIGRVGWTVAYS